MYLSAHCDDSPAQITHHIHDGYEDTRLIKIFSDTSELLNEMITSVKSFGRCGVTGVYVGFVCDLLILPGGPS